MPDDPLPGLAHRGSVNVPERILVRLPNWVGDTVMATPALRAIRAGRPEAEITVEGPPSLRDLLDGLTCFDHFLDDANRGTTATLGRARELRRRAFDLAIILPDSVRSALGPFLARVPRRVGYSRDPLRRVLVTEGPELPRDDAGRRVPIPMVERYLNLSRHLQCQDRGSHVNLTVKPDELQRVDEDLKRLGISPDRKLVVVSPGARFGPSKRWPVEHFSAACDALVERFDLQPLIACAPNEIHLAQEIVAQSPNAIPWRPDGSSTLGGLKALMSRATLAVSNDAGARHVAVALGLPVVVLMGSTDPRHTACNLERQRVLRTGVACSPCHKRTCPIDHRCMTRLAPDLVVSAAEELLG
ncbi:lipopolysaccharide heptosyltransferase II [Myxococcota bacterium]|nr:lipopolysaccharide heptosyltransferase II [Myxococcota bacterium]